MVVFCFGSVVPWTSGSAVAIPAFALCSIGQHPPIRARSFDLNRRSPPYRSGLGRFGPAVMLVVFSIFWVAGLTMWPQPGEPIATVFPSNTPSSQMYRNAVAAGAQEVVALGGWRSVLIVRSTAPDFIGNLYRHGALLVLKAPPKSECAQTSWGQK